MQIYRGLILLVPQNIKLHNLLQLDFFYHVRHFDVWGLAVISLAVISLVINLGITIHRYLITQIQEFFIFKVDQNITAIEKKKKKLLYSDR